MATQQTVFQPIPDREEIDARIAAMLPLVRENALAGERERKVADEVIEAFKGTGIHLALQPRRYGGWERGYETVIDVSSALGTACASTAWVCGLYMIHNWALTLFPEEFQDEIWSETPGGGHFGVLRAGRHRDRGGWRIPSLRPVQVFQRLPACRLESVRRLAPHRLGRRNGARLRADPQQRLSRSTGRAGTMSASPRPGATTCWWTMRSCPRAACSPSPRR